VDNSEPATRNSQLQMALPFIALRNLTKSIKTPWAAENAQPSKPFTQNDLQMRQLFCVNPENSSKNFGK
jgi:hypothetical protein